MPDKQEIRRLQSQAHHLKPEFQVGKEGLNEALIASIRDGFNTKELLKVKMLDTSPDGRAVLKEKLSALPEITLIQNIGHTYILYKKMEEEPKSGDGKNKKEKSPGAKKMMAKKQTRKSSTPRNLSPKKPALKKPVSRKDPSGPIKRGSGGK